jgi:hypothetical protein
MMMSEEKNPYVTTDPYATFRDPLWDCEVHGHVSASMTVKASAEMDRNLPAIDQTYCLRCLCDLWEKLGLKRIKPV